MPDPWFSEAADEPFADDVEAWLRCRVSAYRGLAILETPSDRPAHPDFVELSRQQIYRDFGPPEEM